MSTASVQVLCPNGRRCTVKVNGETTLLQILEEACTRQKFDAAQYNLKYQRSIVDLSLPYRFSNMPNNAKLEMVETDKRRSTASQVALAVQLEDGTRKQGSFPSTSPLWSVLSELGIATGSDEAKEPVIVFMRREVCGRCALQQANLSSIGVTGGTAVLRLLFRQLNKSHDEPCGAQTNVQADQQHCSSGGDTAGQEAQGSHGGDTAGQEAQGPQCDMDVECADRQQRGDDPMEEEGGATLTANPAGSNAQSSGQDVQLTNVQATSIDHGQDTNQCSTAVQQIEEDHPGTALLEEPMFPSHPFKIFPDEEAAPSEPVPPKRRRSDDEVAMVSREAGRERPLAYLYERAFALVNSTPPQVGGAQQEVAVENRSDGTEAALPLLVEPCDREAAVLRRDELASQSSSDAAELPDDFFEVTVDDVKLMQSDLKKQVDKADAPLQTEAGRKAHQARLLGRYKKAVVRVCFPDLWILQGSFRPGESLKALVKFVRDNLADPSISFYLYTSPPKTVLKNGKLTFLEAGFVPSGTVYVSSESLWLPSLSSQCLSLWTRKPEDTRPADDTSV